MYIYVCVCGCVCMCVCGCVCVFMYMFSKTKGNRNASSSSVQKEDGYSCALCRDILLNNYKLLLKTCRDECQSNVGSYCGRWLVSIIIFWSFIVVIVFYIVQYLCCSFILHYSCFISIFLLYSIWFFVFVFKYSLSVYCCYLLTSWCGCSYI